MPTNSLYPGATSRNKVADMLRNTLQGASNAAASNVSAPVDGIAWLLRKAGVPVGDAPMGGSDWMRQKGLTADAPGVGGLLGETVGSIAPIMASAKAAQIAQGLLTMGDNLAAPTTLNSQTGAIVYHGSPHKFDRFDSSKIGTGEGAQAYGHGLYLAESPDVARTYKNAGDGSNFVTVRSIRDPAQMAATALDRAGGDIRHATAVLAQNAQSGDITAGAALQLLKQRAALPESKYAGNLYKVDLPDEAIARMLDWDKPLSQQGQEVNSVLSKLTVTKNPSPAYPDEKWLVGHGAFGFDDAVDAYATKKQAQQALGALTGRQLYQSFEPSLGPVRASELMQKHGIPGIRYLDGGSRSAGQGSSNYVVFPGNEGLLSILKRNGQPLK